MNEEELFKRFMIKSLVGIVDENFSHLANKLKPSEWVDIMSFIAEIVMQTLEQQSKITFVAPYKREK